MGNSSNARGNQKKHHVRDYSLRMSRITDDKILNNSVHEFANKKQPGVSGADLSLHESADFACVPNAQNCSRAGQTSLLAAQPACTPGLLSYNNAEQNAMAIRQVWPAGLAAKSTLQACKLA